MAWNQRADMSNRFRIALGSCIEEYNNKIRIIERSPSSTSSSSSSSSSSTIDSTPTNTNESGFHKVMEFDHPYPATKIMWCPDREPVSPQRDLLATTGDYLRIWNCSGSEPKLEALLNNVSASLDKARFHIILTLLLREYLS
jgi:WD repeat-containing protein 68